MYTLKKGLSSQKQNSSNLIKILFFILVLCFWGKINTQNAYAAPDTESAQRLSVNLSCDGGQNCTPLQDDSYYTTVSFMANQSVTVQSESMMYGIYLIWDLPAVQWTLSYNQTVKQCGTNGFLHEYVAIPEGTTECTLRFSKNASLGDIFAYSDGTLPSTVQVWQPSCSSADILVFSTHADDELLFLGGPVVTYASRSDVRVQVVYMCEFWSSQKVREHEKLDGLWECGVRYYPVNGDFKDLYSMSLEEALKQYSYSDLLAFVTAQIRRFRPQVCVTQDINGEYGHGGHRILVKAFCEAVDNCSDAGFCTASASKYGTWSIPKTYLHLHPENKITLDLRVPIAALGGKTGLDTLKTAYKKHVSQQIWTNLRVDDTYVYSCAAFGLYRTAVGTDSGNDMLEHITTYKVQEELAAKAEQERIEASIAASIAESIHAFEAASEQESRKKAEEELASLAEKAALRKKLVAAGVVLAAVLVTALLWIYYTKRRHKKENS